MAVNVVAEVGGADIMREANTLATHGAVPMITITCSSCARTLRVEDSLAGKKGRCPACKGTFSIPPANAAGETTPHADLSVTTPPAPTGDVTVAPSEGRIVGPHDPRAPAGYEIERELGRGGMGVVYQARSLALRRPCALKMILAGVHSGTDEVARFKREAQAIAQVQHVGIVQVFEIGDHGGQPFMALEFCGGGALDSKLAKDPLKPKDAATLLRKLAEAVQAAHDANVIHRDLKPANVLLTEKGEPKVTDFGLAKKLDEQGLSVTGSVMGTPSYMPPEQARGDKSIGASADVYSLGAILYECLAFRPPFRATTAFDTIMQVLTEDAVPVRQLNRKAPVDLETIAHKCLQKDPKKRYAKAQDLADDLGRYLQGEPIRARPVGNVERAVKWVRRNRMISALTAVILLVLSAGVGVSSWFAHVAGEEAKTARIAEGDAKDQKIRADKKTEEAKKAEEKATAEAVIARKAETEAKTREKAEAAAKALAQEETQRAEAEKTRAEGQLRRAEWAVYAGKLMLAQVAFTENNLPEAFRYLDECQWDLRGWEHRHFRCRFDSSRQTLEGHTRIITSVAWSPDGKRILTGSHDKTAKVWDAEKGTEILTLKGHTGGMTSVTFSPDGRRILTGSYDNTARLWDAEKGTEMLSLKGHTGSVWSVAFSPDGTRILTGSGERFTSGEAKVWETEKGTELLTIKGASGRVVYSPDGRRILSGSADNMAKVWDAEKGTELLALKGASGLVAYSPDGTRILTGSEDKTKVWDAQKGTELLVLKGHTSYVLSVAYSPDGTRIRSRSRIQNCRESFC